MLMVLRTDYAKNRLTGALACLLACFCAPASAWGPAGHHTIGAIADRLIAGSNAAKHVARLLHGGTLQDAAVWADCARAIDPAENYAYTSPGRYPECAIYETPALEAEMADYVRRNDTNCGRGPTEESCHKQYHYADIAVQRRHYLPNETGARNDDIVAATDAAIRVLKGEPAPAPFDIKNKREALLLLAHYVGDIHQPLHVGAVYLDARGRRVDPDKVGFRPATATRGGNQIIVPAGADRLKPTNLHHLWDDIPAAMTVSFVDSKWLARARAVRRTGGALDDWPTAWANQTLYQSRSAFAKVKFGRKKGDNWRATLPANYDAKMDAIKERQLIRAGARLAQVLKAIWP
jgi:hypothetical protein